MYRKSLYSHTNWQSATYKELVNGDGGGGGGYKKLLQWHTNVHGTTYIRDWSIITGVREGRHIVDLLAAFSSLFNFSCNKPSLICIT